MDLKSLPDFESLRFEGLTFAHDRQDAVLSGCDFQFPDKAIARVKSPEGAGKSTLLQILAGLLLPQSGSYVINDQDVINMSFEEFLPYRLRIGFTFDYGGLISNLTIRDNLLLPLKYHNLIPLGEAIARVEDVIERFDLMKFEKERPAHVPGRVRKLAVLLRALVTHPQLLLLDDPSVGLGEGTQVLFAELLKEMREDGRLRHMVISSYDDKFMELLDHDVVHLDGGLLYHQPGELRKAG